MEALVECCHVNIRVELKSGNFVYLNINKQTLQYFVIAHSVK